MTGHEKKRREFVDEYADLFRTGISLLGVDGDLPIEQIEQIRVLRAFLAEGYYAFTEKYAQKTSQKTVSAWMKTQASQYGVNQ
jgi:hypothetical protein